MKSKVVDITKIISVNVKRYRKIKGISQEELSFLSGLHRNYIGMIERSQKKITVYNLQKISQALDVDVCELIKQNE